MREGENEIVRSLTELRDSMQTVFDGEKRTLIAVDDHIKGMSWADIAAPDTSAFLQRLASSLQGIDAIWIADPDGYIKAASEEGMRSGTRVPEQEIFATRERDEVGVYLSTVLEGTPPRIASIDLVRNRLAPNGSFNGTIHVGLSATYFAQLFQVAVPISDNVSLVRSDGEVLASDAKTASYYLDSGSALIRHIAKNPTGETFADREKVYSYLQVPGLPVYISLGISTSAVLQRWYSNLLLYGLAALAASLALAGVSWMALRYTQSEQEALAQLNYETEKRLVTEQQLHHAQRMEAVGQLTAGLAHDFNNLLTIILGSLELLEKARDPEARRRLIERARGAGERGARLVSTLLSFAGRQPLKLQAVNLNELLNDFLPLLRQGAGELVQVELALDPALRDCRADTGQLEATFLNLALNAKDAMPTGGSLSISTRNVGSDSAGVSDGPQPASVPCVAVALRDTGAGMTDDVKAKAFEPFFTTKGVGEGSGLGLSQVLGYVRQVGGHVTLDTELGLGTTVTLYFPQVAPVVGTPEPQARTPSRDTAQQR